MLLTGLPKADPGTPPINPPLEGDGRAGGTEWVLPASVAPLIGFNRFPGWLVLTGGGTGEPMEAGSDFGGMSGLTAVGGTLLPGAWITGAVAPVGGEGTPTVAPPRIGPIPEVAGALDVIRSVLPLRREVVALVGRGTGSIGGIAGVT